MNIEYVERLDDDYQNFINQEKDGYFFQGLVKYVESILALPDLSPYIEALLEEGDLWNKEIETPEGCTNPYKVKKGAIWGDLIQLLVAGYMFSNRSVKFQVQNKNRFPDGIFLHVLNEEVQKINGNEKYARINIVYFQQAIFRQYAERIHAYLKRKLLKKIQKFEVEYRGKMITINKKTDFILDEKMIALRVVKLNMNKTRYSLLFHRKSDVCFEKEVGISEYKGWLIRFLYELRLTPNCSRTRLEIVAKCPHSSSKNVNSLNGVRKGLDLLCEQERVVGLLFTAPEGKWALNPVLSCSRDSSKGSPMSR
jgi:hypothetical protein